VEITLDQSSPLKKEVAIFADKFTDNNIKIFHNDEPEFHCVSPTGVPYNGHPILADSFVSQQERLCTLKEKQLLFHTFSTQNQLILDVFLQFGRLKKVKRNSILK